MHLKEEIRDAEQEIVGLLRDGGDGAGNDQADVGSTTLERDHEMSLAQERQRHAGPDRAGAGPDRRRHLRRLRELRQGDRQGAAAGVPACDTVRVMQRTRRTPLSTEDRSSPRAADADEPNGPDDRLPGPIPTPARAEPEVRPSCRRRRDAGRCCSPVVGLVVLGAGPVDEGAGAAAFDAGGAGERGRLAAEVQPDPQPGRGVQPRHGYTPVISAIQIIVAVGVVWLSRRLGSVGWAIAFGLLFGGAVGNITDRNFRDAVAVPRARGRLPADSALGDLQRRRHGRHLGRGPAGASRPCAGVGLDGQPRQAMRRLRSERRCPHRDGSGRPGR